MNKGKSKSIEHTNIHVSLIPIKRFCIAIFPYSNKLWQKENLVCNVVKIVNSKLKSMGWIKKCIFKKEKKYTP